MRFQSIYQQFQEGSGEFDNDSIRRSMINKSEANSQYFYSKLEKPSLNPGPRTKSKLNKPKPPSKPEFSAPDIEKDLLQEIKSAEQLISQLNTILPRPKIHNGQVSVEELRNMEEEIRRKNGLIQEIEQEINMLKNGTFHQEDKLDDPKTILGREVKFKREALALLKIQYLESLKMGEKKRQMMASVQENFRRRCEMQKIEYLTFEEFKQMELKKAKEMARIDKYKKIPRKQISSIKEIVSSRNQPSSLQADSKKMKDLLNRKNVAQTALKTAKRRHALEIADLMGKLEFLQDEYQELSDKLLMKENELKVVQTKFSHSRHKSEKKLLTRRLNTERNL